MPSSMPVVFSGWNALQVTVFMWSSREGQGSVWKHLKETTVEGILCYPMEGLSGSGRRVLCETIRWVNDDNSSCEGRR